MGEQMQQNWEQEPLARGEVRGALKTCRKMVCKALEKRFGPLPEVVVQQIETAGLPALEAVFDRVDTIQSLDELAL